MHSLFSLYGRRCACGEHSRTRGGWTRGRPGRPRDCRACRWLLLGCSGCFRARQRSRPGRVGYAGGNDSTAHYDLVSTGTTGHAESVQITYDPSQITYGQLLRIFFSVVHDPTQLDRQGPDVGTQYRSAIFPRILRRKRIAESDIAQLYGAKVFGAPIVTRIENASGFVPAEAHHQDFLILPPDLSLCRHQRHAQARQPHAPIPGSVSRKTRPRRRGVAAEVETGSPQHCNGSARRRRYMRSSTAQQRCQSMLFGSI